MRQTALEFFHLVHLLSALLAICIFGGLYSETGFKEHRKKIYVNKSAVEFCDAGIRVKTNKGLMVTKAIHFDEYGLYFVTSEATMIKSASGMYYCPGRGCGASFPNSSALAMHMKHCRSCKNH